MTIQHRSVPARPARAPRTPNVAAAPATNGSDVGHPAGRLARRDVLPLALSVFQFGVAIGATIAVSDVDPLAALAGMATLSAGTAQLAAIDLLDAGGGIIFAVMTAVVINVRFVLYGAGFARWFADAPRWQRCTMVFPIVDQSFMLCESRFADHTDLGWRRRYYVAVCSALFVGFAAGQIAGFAIGDLIPEQAGLDLAGPIVFAGLLALATENRATMRAALVAGITVVVAASAPSGLGLPIAAVAGLTIGGRPMGRPTSQVAS